MNESRELAVDFNRMSKRLAEQFEQLALRIGVQMESSKALLDMLSPAYALANEVPKDDPRITSEYQKYPSPNGNGEMRGLLAQPRNAVGKLPGVIVVHENRGLNPYIEDVTRRLAVVALSSMVSSSR